MLECWNSTSWKWNGCYFYSNNIPASCYFTLLYYLEHVLQHK